MSTVDFVNEIIAHDYETIYTLRCTKIAQVQNLSAVLQVHACYKARLVVDDHM